MKTFLAAGLGLAAGAGAWAQGVTMYGTVDLYVAHARSGSSSWTRMQDGGHTASRLGFRGTEDLGGGLRAGFVLESGISPDTGLGNLPGPELSFTRQSFVSLAGAWGQVDLGRMYTPMFYTLFRADPYGLNAVFSPLNLVAATDAQPGAQAFAGRASNMVRYRTPQGDGFWLDAAFGFGEAAQASRRSGQFEGAAAGWTGERLTLAYAFQRAHGGSATAPLADPPRTTYQALSATYKLGDLDLYANHVRVRSSLAGVPQSRLTSLGARYSFTAVSQLMVEAVDRRVDGSARRQLGWTLGYDHHLSRRTTLYARWLGLGNHADASATLAGVTVAANSGDAVRVLAAGIRHNF